MPATITARDLRKSYGDLRAVDGVTFEVAPGEFFGILGPNGAGKTTTLEIIEGLRQADAGEATVLGLPPWPRNPALLPRIGVQLQASSFFERLTAREQLCTFASLGGRRCPRRAATAGERVPEPVPGHVPRVRPGPGRAGVHDPDPGDLPRPARPVFASIVQQADQQAAGRPAAFRLTTRQVEDQSLKPIQYFAPGLLGWAIASGATFGAGITLVTWRQNKLLRRLRLAPASTSAVVGARIGISLVIAMVQLAVFFAIATTPYFGLKLTASWWMAILIVACGTLAFMSIGLLVGSFAKTQQAASSIANLIILPMAFLGGAFFPLNFAPAWLQDVSYAMPLRYLVLGMQDVLARGDGPASALPAIGILLGAAAVLTLISVRVFRWDQFNPGIP